MGDCMIDLLFLEYMGVRIWRHTETYRLGLFDIDLPSLFA